VDGLAEPMSGEECRHWAGTPLPYIRLLNFDIAAFQSRRAGIRERAGLGRDQLVLDVDAKRIGRLLPVAAVAEADRKSDTRLRQRPAAVQGWVLPLEVPGAAGGCLAGGCFYIAVQSALQPPLAAVDQQQLAFVGAIGAALVVGLADGEAKVDPPAAVQCVPAAAVDRAAPGLLPAAWRCRRRGHSWTCRRSWR
jgi:hypothetical protein